MLALSPAAIGAAAFATAGLACAVAFTAAFLADNRHLVPDLSWLGELLGDVAYWLRGLLPEPAAPVAAALPAVYFCAASGRWRDRETKRFAKAPAA